MPRNSGNLPSSKEPRVLAFIPARGGSKGIPRKNIYNLNGQPLLSYSIAAAQAASSVGRIIVSTDDHEIAAVARNCGAEVPFLRPAELATDTTPGLPVVQHALNWLAVHQQYVPDIVLELQPTAPLRLAADIDAAVQLLINSSADSVIGVCAGEHPYYLFRQDRDNKLLPLLPDRPAAFRRQDLEPVWRQNGALIVVWQQVITEQNSFYGSSILPHIMPIERSLDIDTPMDMVIAEALLRQRQQAETAGRRNPQAPSCEF